MEKTLPILAAVAALAAAAPSPASSEEATNRTDAAEAPPPAMECKVVGEDVWHGYRRTLLDFGGHAAWIVEPRGEPAEGKPWTWTMQWADAFVDRTGVLDLLAKGWHHVTIDTYAHRMDDEGLRVSRAFQRFLVDDRGLAPKARLVGMSWGGFFSVRYAAAYPECVARIWLDGPLLTFDGYDIGRAGPWAATKPPDGDWSKDPRMPINLAEKLIEARIPVLLYYGGQDRTVDPARNAEALRAVYRRAGEENRLLVVKPRPFFGHHPHGEDPDKTAPIVRFLEAAP